MKHRFGLKSRFIGLIVALLTTIFTVIAFTLIHTDGSSLRQQLFSSSKAFAALATKPIGDTYVIYQSSGTILITQQVANFTQLDDTVSNVSVVNTTGNIKYSLNKGAAPVSPGQAASFQPIYIYNKQNSIKRIIYPFIGDDGSHQYALVYDISSASVNKAVRQLEQSIIIYSLIGLVVSAIVTYLLINRLFLIPIKELRDQALIISSGYYREEITVVRNDEIGDLAQSVKQMATTLTDDINKLKEVDKVKSEFMMIASHNLRTPLTIIDGNLELARSQTISEALGKILSNIETNSQRLKIFAEDLLIISSVEAGQKIFTTETLDIDSLINRIAKDFANMAETKHVKFIPSIATTNVQIQGSSVHLRNAIYNLLDNALKFTPENGTIEMGMIHSGETIQISVKDDGAGIAPDEISKLFTKFHRGTSTLEYNYDGSGIGLYLTRLIITEHRGSIDVKSELGKGSTFTITLPVPDQAAETTPPAAAPVPTPPSTS
jgi:signal transduction histidine kinase